MHDAAEARMYEFARMLFHGFLIFLILRQLLRFRSLRLVAQRQGRWFRQATLQALIFLYGYAACIGGGFVFYYGARLLFARWIVAREQQNVRLPSGRRTSFFYRAYSTIFISRSKFTLISPGYLSCSSIFLAMSFANWRARTSSILSGVTNTRISRPAWMA